MHDYHIDCFNHPEECRLRKIEKAIDFCLAHINTYEHVKPYIRRPSWSLPDNYQLQLEGLAETRPLNTQFRQQANPAEAGLS